MYMRKITYYENILEFKENSKEELNVNEINNWQLCRTCLADMDEDDVNMEQMSVIDVMQGSFLSIKEMLVKTTNIQFTSTEKLPLKVCKGCFSNITALYYFFLQVHKADNVLKRLASKLKGYEDILEVCKSEDNVTKDEMPEDGVIFEIEEVFHNIQDSEHFEGNLNISIDENEVFTESLEKPADIKETPDWVEEISESKSVLLNDEEYHSDLKNEYSYEESYLEKDMFEGLENSDVDYEETFDDSSTVTTTNTITTEEVKYEVKRLKRFSNDTPTSGYRHKQPRVSSPLLTNFTCAICQDSFGRQHDLVHHVRKSHPNSKAYKCRVCGNLFSHIQSLSRHMNSHKEAVVLNECEFCPKTFVRADDLKRHLRVHTGERPYVCVICGKSFQQQFAWKSHQDKHCFGDINLRRRKFECTECEQTYISRNGLYIHKRKHHREDSDGLGHPYVCALCETSFHLQSELKRHEQKHFLPELIKCTECDKYFKSQNGIYMHKKSTTKVTDRWKGNL